MEQDQQVWVIVPAYNESAIIEKVIEGLVKYPYHILIVDDGSTDCTPYIASRYPITVLRHPINLGQGAALQTGIGYVLRKTDARFLVTFDSDGQHFPEDIPFLLEPLISGYYDVSLGSRFLKHGAATNIPKSKLFTLKLAILYSCLSTGLKLTDTHNGIRAFSRQAAEKIELTQNGMAHASEILSEISLKKLRYCEIPVNIIYTDYSLLKGQSIINSINILWDSFIGKLR